VGIVLALMVVALILIRMGVQLFNREELLGREIDSISLRGIMRRAGQYLWRSHRISRAPISTRSACIAIMFRLRCADRAMPFSLWLWR
jgi:hypothetical protein